VYGYDASVNAGPAARWSRTMGVGYPDRRPPTPAVAAVAVDACGPSPPGPMAAEYSRPSLTHLPVVCPRGENPGFLALHGHPAAVTDFQHAEGAAALPGKESKVLRDHRAEVLALLPTGYASCSTSTDSTGWGSTRNGRADDDFTLRRCTAATLRLSYG